MLRQVCHLEPRLCGFRDDFFRRVVIGLLEHALDFLELLIRHGFDLFLGLPWHLAAPLVGLDLDYVAADVSKLVELVRVVEFHLFWHCCCSAHHC